MRRKLFIRENKSDLYTKKWGFLSGTNYSAEKTAEKLYISRKTIEAHLAKIKNKLNCRDKSRIVNKAIDEGFIDLMFMRF